MSWVHREPFPCQAKRLVKSNKHQSVEALDSEQAELPDEHDRERLCNGDFVVMPNHPARTVWDYFLIVFVLYSSITVPMSLPASIGSPNFQARVFATTRSVNSAATFSCTSMRLTAVQRWPEFL